MTVLTIGGRKFLIVSRSRKRGSDGGGRMLSRASVTRVHMSRGQTAGICDTTTREVSCIRWLILCLSSSIKETGKCLISR